MTKKAIFISVLGVCTALSVGGCDENSTVTASSKPVAVEPHTQDIAPTKDMFFPVAISPTVANCAREAEEFDTNRRPDKARAVELVCQDAMNNYSNSDECRNYAREITNAAYKFWRSMEEDAGRAAILGEEMRAHIKEAEKSAPRCT